MSETPPLSVVIASVNGLPYVARCLDALSRNAPEAEVIVADATDEATRAEVAERFPKVRLIEANGAATVPALRAAGIAAAHAPYVAVIEDHCLVRPGWARRIVEWHRDGKPAVGGPVNNVVDERLRDWAAFFCEYNAYVEPMPLGSTNDLTGMNVSYDRRAIEAMQDLLDDGRWEVWLHGRLRERQLELWCDPELRDRPRQGLRVPRIRRAAVPLLPCVRGDAEPGPRVEARPSIASEHRSCRRSSTTAWRGTFRARRGSGARSSARPR